MNAARSFDVPPAAYRQLADYLRLSGKKLSPAEAISSSIKLWIEADRAVAAPLHGYQWKSLFLPTTTLVRMSYNGNSHYAEVVDENIIFRGHPVSPRQMTIEIAGDGRNAWRDLWLRLPGERSWTGAARLRAQSQKQATNRPPSPAEALAAAAQTMSGALNAALMLIEHVDHQSQNTLERRIPRHRRDYDELTDDH